MAFSELQYSNKKSIASGETWTKEDNILDLSMADNISSGMTLTFAVANPQGIYQDRYSPFQRIRVLDRPSNLVVFLGRVVDIQNDHRKQALKIVCHDYTVDLSQSSVPSIGLFGNRRSDIVKDIVSGGIEKGRTVGFHNGSNAQQDYIIDSSKSFDSTYMGKIVKVEGVGPGRVASGSSGSTLNTDNYGTSTTGPFNASHVGRMIRRFRSYRDTTMDPTVIRKQILWEGVVAELTDANTITTGTAIDSTGNGVETALSGGADYSSAASAWSENGDSWEIIGYYGKIVAIVNSTTIQVENVGSDTALTFNGYKDANFYSWGTGNAANLAAGGIEYFIESAEDGIFQATLGQEHTGDKSVDTYSQVDKSPYLEYIRKSYGQGQSGSEGGKESIERLGKDEVWKVPKVLFYSGSMGTDLGLKKNQWHLMTAEANTGIDLLHKPVMAGLPLETPVYRGSSGTDYVRVHTDHDSSSEWLTKRVFFRNPDGTEANIEAHADQGANFFDHRDSSKNRIQIGNEERRVVGYSNNLGSRYVNIDKPFNRSYTHTDDLTSTDFGGGGVRRGRHIGYGGTDLVTNGTFASNITGWAETSNATPNDEGDGSIAHTSGAIRITTENATGSHTFAEQPITTMIGQEYLISADLVSESGSDYQYLQAGTQAHSSNATPGAGAAQSNSKNLGAIQSVDAGNTASFTFIATTATTYIRVGTGTPTAGSGWTQWDNISVKRIDDSDSRLYIGSENIFNAIQFDMDDSPGMYHSMEIEFWGRSSANDTHFGWQRIEDYAIDAAQLESATHSSFISLPEEDSTDGVKRGIDNFNQSGIIKWWDLSSQTTPTWDGGSQTRPNKDWNHWAKNNLMNEEPIVHEGKSNTINTEQHNHTMKGGDFINSLEDPELSNLYWIRISVPRDEYGWQEGELAKESTRPGFIRNIRILDGRNSATTSNANWEDFDTTVRKYPYARWDFRMENPTFFDVIGKADTAANPNTWDDYTKAMTSRSLAESFNAFNSSWYGTGKYVYFGSDYQFSGIEFNLINPPSNAIQPIFEYWNGIHWAALEDLNGFGFNSTMGQVRWDLEGFNTNDTGTRGGTNSDVSSTYMGQTKWSKRDLRAANGIWGGYNYDSSSGTKNPYIPPSSATGSYGLIQTGDIAQQTDYPGGRGNVQNTAVPHHHLYWVRMSVTANTPGANDEYVFSTIRTFSKPSLKYYERGTEPWNFNLTGTESLGDGTTFGYGKHDFRDASGQFTRVGVDKMWIKNTSTPDTSNSVANIVSASRPGLQPALKRGGISTSTNTQTETTANLASEKTDRLSLSAGLFIHNYAPNDYAGRDGGRYLLYQDKRYGVKAYDTYGGDTSTRDNWHGLHFKYRTSKDVEKGVVPIYRYNIDELPSSMITRVTVNGAAPITATAIDTESETTYGIRQEKISYDRTILSIPEAQAAADSLLTTFKPLSNQTSKRIIVEVYDYPVYKYNSATTATINRDINHAVRAGDMIKITLNDGANVLTAEPFLVNNIEYKDKNSLTKITCTQGIFPATTETSTPWNDNYKLALESRNAAQHIAAAGETATNKQVFTTETGVGSSEGTSYVSFHPDHTAELIGENLIIVDGNNTAGIANSSTTSKEEDSTHKINSVQGAMAVQEGFSIVNAGTVDNADFYTHSNTFGTGTNTIVVAETQAFYSQRGGFTPPEDWLGATVVDNATGEKYTVIDVPHPRKITTSGNKVWAANASVTVRRKASILENPSIPKDSGVIIYRKDLGIYEARTTAAVRSPDNITSPFWGQMMSGFTGARNTGTNGRLVIDLNVDHSYTLGLKTKPMVFLTVDATDSSGAQTGNAWRRRAWANVRRFLDASNQVSAPQYGTAGTGSGTSGGYGLLKAQGAAGGSDNQSFFTTSVVGNKVYKLNAQGQIIGTGTVQALVDAATVTTTGDGADLSPTTSWTASTNRYIIDADIHRIEVQVWFPAVPIGTANSNHKHALLLDANEEFATSKNGSSGDRLKFAEEADAKVGVMYQILPRPNKLDNIPFTDIYGNDS